MYSAKAGRLKRGGKGSCVVGWKKGRSSALLGWCSCPRRRRPRFAGSWPPWAFHSWAPTRRCTYRAAMHAKAPSHRRSGPQSAVAVRRRRPTGAENEVQTQSCSHLPIMPGKAQVGLETCFSRQSSSGCTYQWVIPCKTWCIEVVLDHHNICSRCR